MSVRTVCIRCLVSHRIDEEHGQSDCKELALLKAEVERLRRAHDELANARRQDLAKVAAERDKAVQANAALAAAEEELAREVANEVADEARAVGPCERLDLDELADRVVRRRRLRVIL